MLIYKKGGSVSSVPKQKIKKIPKKVKKSLKKFEKMLKVVTLAKINPNFASEIKPDIKILNELNLIKTENPHAILPKSLYGVYKASTRFKKYTSKNNKRKNTYDKLTNYFKLKGNTSQNFNTSSSLHTALKTTFGKNIKSQEDQKLLINEIKKILHPQPSI